MAHPLETSAMLRSIVALYAVAAATVSASASAPHGEAATASASASAPHDQAATALGAHIMSQLQQSSCGTADFDMSSLKAGSDYLFEGTGSVSNQKWFVNVCQNTVSTCSTVKTPGIWNYYKTSPTACYQLGTLESAAWSALPDASALGVRVKYTGGSTCYSTTPFGSYSLEVQFTCDASKTPGGISAVAFGADQCSFVATFPTSAACGGGSGAGSGSSAGAWAFNIIVLVGLPVYFAGGFLYNWKHLGKEGNDRIPHLSFWLELPHLVRDGCIYFLYLCKLAAFKVGILSVAPDSPVAAPPPAYSSSSGSSSYGEATPSEFTATGYGATTSAYGGAGQYGAI